tara:strand:+ start:2388 stop:4079 length:1692 start_codon:yes stop_codon:yes gene_type:complete
MSSDNWISSDNLKTGSETLEDKKYLIDNIRENINLIDHWITQSYAHVSHAIIVSGGDSLDFDEIKQAKLKYPNSKIFCVKHSLKKLIENGIEPDMCVIVDNRNIKDKSSWGYNRDDLILVKGKIDTIFCILSRANPGYTKLLKENGNKILGFHIYIQEVLDALDIDYIPEKNNDMELKRRLSILTNSNITLQGSCAAMQCLNIAYFMGFRKMHLFGYDGNIKKPGPDQINKKDNDGNRIYFRTQCNNKIFWTCTEFLVMASEFENKFQTYPTTFGIKFYFYKGKNETLISNIYDSIIKNLSMNDSYFNFEQYSLSNNNYYKEFKNITEKKAKYFNKLIRSNNNDLVIKSFHDYNEYKQYQIESADKEIIISNRECIELISDHIEDILGEDIKYGICHGSYFGHEQKFFSEELDCEVLGTDICQNVNKFDNNTIIWDYHEIKGEWIKKFDFIYSNSLDHSYDPFFCLEQWMKCLNENGICILEWTSIHDVGAIKKQEPFKASLDRYKKIITEKYELIDIIKSPRSYPIYNSNGKKITKPLFRFFIIFKNKINERKTKIIQNMNN